MIPTAGYRNGPKYCPHTSGKNETQDARAEASAQAEHATFRGRWLPWLFLLPTLLVLAVFSYYPAARALRLSVFRANLIVSNESSCASPISPSCCPARCSIR